MIATENCKIRIIEEGLEIFVGDSDPDSVIKGLNDIIYCRNIDFYLIYQNNKIYKKDIDGNLPYLFLDLICGPKFGHRFIYSDIHERLIIAKDKITRSSINLETKEIEIEIPKSEGDSIVHLELYRKDQDRVVALTKDGYLFASELDFSKKQGEIITVISIGHMINKLEEAGTVVVCPRSRYFFVEVYMNDPEFHFCSKMIIFSLKNETFQREAVFCNYGHYYIGCKAVMNCLGYFKNTIVFMGLTLMKGSYAQLFSYNTDTKEFEEMKEVRVKHQEFDPFKMTKVGNSFYYTGRWSKIMKLTVKSKSD